MANWLKVKVNMEKVSDAEQRERLGIDYEPDEDVWGEIVINLDRVSTYAPSYDAELEPIEGRCVVTLDTGEFISLNMDFNKLDKILRLKDVKAKVEKKED